LASGRGVDTVVGDLDNCEEGVRGGVNNRLVGGGAAVVCWVQEV
jgi:hypothetical protein